MMCEQRERAFKEGHGLDNLLEEIRSFFLEQDNIKSYNWLEKLIDSALNNKVAPLRETQEIYIPDIRDLHLDEQSYEPRYRHHSTSSQPSWSSLKKTN
ncbi:hypothetical protein [Bartonella sp. OT172YNZD]|uniref:hypothetical protein n=1 Tax=Bartonella sp. OT172YNZD TaxID=3243572 RepID=UPI0035CFB610